MGIGKFNNLRSTDMGVIKLLLDNNSCARTVDPMNRVLKSNGIHRIAEIADMTRSIRCSEQLYILIVRPTRVYMVSVPEPQWQDNAQWPLPLRVAFLAGEGKSEIFCPIGSLSC
jgi:hypothetical protein